MSDLGLSGVTALPPFDCGAADRVRLLDRTFTGWATGAPPAAAGLHGFAAT